VVLRDAVVAEETFFLWLSEDGRGYRPRVYSVWRARMGEALRAGR
jgi:hypothetical protein